MSSAPARPSQNPPPAASAAPVVQVPEPAALVRVTSASLMQSMREIEIDHEGRIYHLRITHSNKLILTA